MSRDEPICITDPSAFFVNLINVIRQNQTCLKVIYSSVTNFFSKGHQLSHPLSLPVAQTVMCDRKWPLTLASQKTADWLECLFLLSDWLLDLSISKKNCSKFATFIDKLLIYLIVQLFNNRCSSSCFPLIVVALKFLTTEGQLELTHSTSQATSWQLGHLKTHLRPQSFSGGGWNEMSQLCFLFTTMSNLSGWSLFRIHYLACA